MEGGLRKVKKVTLLPYMEGGSLKIIKSLLLNTWEEAYEKW